MKIGFLLVKNLHRGGGIESYTYEVGKRLTQRGHEVVVYGLNHYGPSDPSIEGIRCVNVRSIPGVPTERLSGSFVALYRALIDRPRFDILHLHTPMTGIFGLVPQMLGLPVIIQMHGVDWKRSRWGPLARNTIRSLEAAVLRSGMPCTAVSMTQCAFYEKEYGRIMKMIPTGLTFPTPSTETDELKRLNLEVGRFVLFASRFVREKGAQYLIEAFRNLPTDFKLVLAGSDAHDNRHGNLLKAMAHGDSRIVFPGFVTGRLKSQLLANAAVFVLPSEIEGLSIALLEAMAYGRPVLVSDIPENREAVADAGVTFRNQDAADLQEKLGMLIDSVELREQYSTASRQRLDKLSSWDTIVDSLLTYYGSVIGSYKSDGGLELQKVPQSTDVTPPVRPSGNTIWTRKRDEQEQAHGGGDHHRAEAGGGRAQG